jgi:hypothetical protein
MEPILPEAQPGQLLLIVAPARLTRQIVLELTAKLAIRGPVDVFDGGNGFDAHRVARTLRRQTADLASALRRIHIARAFTCYQAAAHLANIPATANPKLIMDLLATFYDENVALPESTRLLAQCIEHLQRLSRAAPVVMSSSPPLARQEARLSLLHQLDACAGRTLVFEGLPPPEPPVLF